ncbi:hypothetical protein ACJJTC_017374 [Scirpophaga incertulas]
MLSGEELLSKGITKRQVTLPIIGNKDITPNNSWLEKQQIQSAIESRKQLIGAQRIEKSGVLCHAVWQEDLRLAEVTQQTGNFWNFIGLTKDKKLYLKPEEALFLIEVNSLLLTYNDVTVTLQQAYALLLREDVSVTKYKVYSSLSRLGYKVLQHIDPGIDTKKENERGENGTIQDATVDIREKSNEENKVKDTCQELIICKETENEQDMKIDLVQDNQVENDTKITSNKSSTENVGNDNENMTKDAFTLFCKKKLQFLKSRQQNACGDIFKCFESVPDISPKSCISTYIQIEVPKNEYIPKNISLSETTYLLNVNNITLPNIKSSTTNDRLPSASDETNADDIRHVTNSNPIPELINTRPPFYQNNLSNTLYQCWPRPSNNAYCYSQGNFLYRIPYTSLNQPTFAFYPRTNMSMLPRYFINPTNWNNNSQRPLLQQQQIGNLSRKRKKTNYRKQHLESIRNIAGRFRNLVSSGCIQAHSRHSLQKLIKTYNLRYHVNLVLTDTFELTYDDKNIETIELEDDEAPKAKKLCNGNIQKTHLKKIQEIAYKLKLLKSDGKLSPMHKRAFSKLINTFNKSYNAEIYINDNLEVLDRRSITLDSSSDSDCVVEEELKTCGKKLQNPFNILKRLSEKLNTSPIPTTSVHQDEHNDKENFASLPKAQCSKSYLQNYFDECWLPNRNEFGKPEIVSLNDLNHRIMEAKKEEYFYEFIKNNSYEFQNWTEAKIDFWQSIEDANENLRKEALKANKFDIKSLISKDDRTNLAVVIDKIRIIKSNNTTSNECSLTVHFDVYNRDVHNFRKTARPKPHFRIVCLEESSKCPTGRDIATLHSKYNDNVRIVFAFVGSDAITYLEMNPVELSL